MATELAVDPAQWVEVVTWLDHEAELLDDGQFEQWLELLADDLRYEMPVRITRERGGGPDADPGSLHFLENAQTLRLRVERLKSDFAWAEDPPSRTRRFVTNVRPRPCEDGVEVRSNLLLYRSRGDDTSVELISAERRDHLRRSAHGYRLARRTIRVDQSTLGVRNLAVML